MKIIRFLSFFTAFCFTITTVLADEMWTIGVKSDLPGNPIYLSHLEDGAWKTEILPLSSQFSENYRPCLGVSPSGEHWVVWAALKEGEEARIHYSYLQSGSWKAAEAVASPSSGWESAPMITFDPQGRPWVAWVKVAGESSEIFSSRWENGSFGLEVMVSTPDDSPDGHPFLTFYKNCDPAVVWQGWQDGHAQIFHNRFISGSWSQEQLVSPERGVDQVLPTARRPEGERLSISWWQQGKRVTFEEGWGKSKWLKAIKTQMPSLTGENLPVPDRGAWVLKKNELGQWELFRYQMLPLPVSFKTMKESGGLFPASYHFIGYGDSITYGHCDGSDVSGWYGSLLSGTLENLNPGNSYHFYNEGYPGAKTHDMLYGGGEWGCPGIYGVIDNHPAATKILIMGGTNDIGHGEPLLDIKWNLGQMINRARNKGIEPVLGTIIPRVDHTANFTRSTNLCLDYITPLAVEKDCLVADPFGVFMNYWNTDYFWEELYGYPDYWDGIHPCWPEGDQKIANAWFAALSEPESELILDSGDYNGDGSSDIAIFRSSSGLWVVRNVTRLYFGTQRYIPASGDYNGDGTTDIALFCRGLWVVRNITRAYFGGSNDISVPGDYNGNGCCEMGIFRISSGLWAIRGLTRVYFGSEGDRPVPGYYNGSRAKDIAIFRPATNMWAIRDVSRIYFGTAGDRPVPADYTGDDHWDPAIFRSAAALWAIRDVTRDYFGSSADNPVTPDLDGDGTDEIGIFRKSSGLWAIRGVTRIYFGTSGDIPVPGRVCNPITPTPTPAPTSTPTPVPPATPSPSPTPTSP